MQDAELLANCLAGGCGSNASTAPRFARSRWPSLRSGHCLMMMVQSDQLSPAVAVVSAHFARLGQSAPRTGLGESTVRRTTSDRCRIHQGRAADGVDRRSAAKKVQGLRRDSDNKERPWPAYFLSANILISRKKPYIPFDGDAQKGGVG
jgi:hypothetical protein